MSQMKTNTEGKLFSRNFTLLVFGQVSSLFANTILRFALSMYILDLTGSASIFAGLLAVSMIPTVILSPFGGVLADRANRRNIMVGLDFLSGVIAVFTMLTIRESNAVIIVGTALTAYSILAAFESPTVQAAVPQMQTGDNIIKANAVVNQVAALAALIAPFIGSACYTAFGVKTVLAVSVLGFFLTAFLEIFIRLPFTKETLHESWIRVIRNDFKISFSFITRERPEIMKILLAASAISFFIMGTVNVGMPFMIRTILGLNAEYAGAAESVCGLTAILGSVIVGVAAGRLKADKMYQYPLAVGICMIPMGMGFLLDNEKMIYLIILLSIAVMQVLVSIFSIYCVSLIQQRTPNELLGKVMAYVATVTLCAQPLGQVIYGVLFDAFRNNVMWIMVGSAVCIILLSVAARPAFLGIKDLEQGEGNLNME
ncbi:MFS transporter [Faecalicatena orotica]|uniref:MFS transporter n=1 Tax=Faecalicatena orotica TaxID=1544 RepID=A0A2Y9BNJ6_9FIRM|nr:MFS transporter [Faecalicatena orotica]PWJ23698.1 MFS transporter [Faecalicatena orotica]SSA57610.1 Major Facilitator Superfamily protein [Faecalicatena orotica]